MPEELEAAADTRDFVAGKLFLRYQVMSIGAGRSYVEDLQAKLTAFDIRTVEYYRNRNK